MRYLQFVRIISRVFITGLLAILSWMPDNVFASDTWSQTFASTYGNWANAVERTADGGSIIAGQYVAAKGVGEYVNDMLLVKLNSAGAIEWQKKYGGGSAADSAASVRQTADGGFIVAGWSDSFGGWRQAWLLKLDAAGSIEWQRVYGGAGYEEATAVEQTADNGFIVAGLTGSYDNGTNRAWLLRLAADGAVLWQKRFALAGDNTLFYDVKQTADGGFLAGGGSNSGALIVKVNASGATLWQKLYGDASGSLGWIRSLGLTRDGSSIAGGTLYLSTGESAGWMMKLAADGSVQWHKIYGGGGQKHINGIRQTSDGEFIVNGEVNDFGGAGKAGWIMKLDAFGWPVWQKAYGSGGYNGIRGLQERAGGGYVGAGYLTTIAADYASGVIAVASDGTIDACGSDFIRDTHALASSGAWAARTAPVGNYATAVSAQASSSSAVYASLSSKNACEARKPRIAVSPSSINFGNTELFASSVRNITVTNTGTADLTISSVAVSGSDTSAFGQTNACATVAPNASCVVMAGFSPLSPGAKNAAIVVASNDAETPALNVPLTGIGVDTVPPTTAIIMSGKRGAGDWYISNVGITLTAADTGTGVKDIHYRVDGADNMVSGSAASFIAAVEGIQTLSYHAVDMAGNSESVHSSVIQIDKTAPSILSSVTASANAGGWYHTNVTVAFTCTDSGSGIASCTSPVAVTAEGANLIIEGQATDKAGNAAVRSLALNIDRTGPVITVAGVQNGATYELGLVPSARYGVMDALSGMATSGAELTGGDGLGLGTFNYSVTAADNAGNTSLATVTYQVIATQNGMTALLADLLASGQVDPNTAGSLQVKLDNALTGNPAAADAKLQAFINEVNAQTGKKITAEAAAVLINAALYIMNNN